MRIEIEIGAAKNPDSHRWLDRILHKIEDGWHVWDTTAQPDPSEIETTTWIRDRGSQGDWVRQLLVASVQRGAWSLAPHERRVRVTARPAAGEEEELAPEHATRLAEEPMVVLVENRDSDGAFVKRIVADLDRSLNSVWHCEGCPIRIDSLGGGGQMPAEIERRTRDRPYRPRLVVIVDSDRKGPGDSESDAARRVRRKCESAGVPCWVLAKREAENYLPRVLLAERPDVGLEHARSVDAWDGLTDDQKDFFDMKNGLPEEPSEIEQALFDGLSPADRTILARGFGPNVYRCWNLRGVQAASDLRRRGKGDLDAGIDLIRGEV